MALEFGAMILGMPDTTYFAEIDRSPFIRLDNPASGESNTLGGTITGSLGMILPATFFSAHENSLQADLAYSQTRIKPGRKPSGHWPGCF